MLTGSSSRGLGEGSSAMSTTGLQRGILARLTTRRRRGVSLGMVTRILVIAMMVLAACGNRGQTLCQFVLTNGGVCDDHHLIPRPESPFRHVINSRPDGAVVFMYMPELKRLRRVGHTPFTFAFTTKQVGYCVGLPVDLSRCVHAEPRDMTILCDQSQGAWVCSTASTAPGQ